MVKAKKFVMKNSFKDVPKETDFELVEEELRPLREGEYLVEAVYLSVDPYMRAYSHQIQEGDTMIGGQVAKIIDSKTRSFPVGKYVMGYFGWRTHTIVDDTKSLGTHEKPYILPDFQGLPLSLGIGVLGMTGCTSYFGFLEICQPKSGETVVITGAAGAVGSHVGQIAKIRGCTVIGITGSDEKCKWIKELGFDHAINYKKGNLGTMLAEAAPRGVDCYFDNVGGEMSSTVISKMNKFGRISVCGSISSYNNDFHNLPKATIIQPALVANQLKMEGFLVGRWSNKYMEAINQNMEWIRKNRLVYRETVYEGFESMTRAFIGLFSGENIGKSVVKV